MTVLRVLMVEDDADDAELILHELGRGWRVEAHRVDDEIGLRAALTERWDVVLSDWTLPIPLSGLAALRIVRSIEPDLPFIIVSGTIGEEVAVDAIRTGANDYVLKDRLTRLRPAIERELEARAHERAHRAERRTAEATRSALEERLRQAQKMEAMGSLAGGVAHDFNNLLSVILSYSEILREDLPPADPMKEDLDQINAAAHRAADLTRQLLAFSRRQLLEPAVVDPNEIVVELHKLLRRLIGEDVELVVTPASDVGRIRVDPGQFEQVLVNLAINARDAMPAGGRLTIATANVAIDDDRARAVDGLKRGSYAMISVSDTGTGMDPATQARIFDPFFTTKEQGKGTGLGLATAYGIVQQSNGHIEVASELGHGTTFKIYMPHTDRTGPTPRTTQIIAPIRGTETILVVEDELEVRAVVRTILLRYGYQVLEAQSAGDALLLCEQHQGAIDLLLSDVVMPRMSGPLLADRLVSMRPNLRILLMSGYTDHAMQERVARPGVAFLQKPITPELLARKVREVLGAPA